MFSIQSERSEDGAAYVAAGWASPARPALYGTPVVSTAAVPVGFALVIDARYAYIADREVVSVRMTESNKDDFERNLVTIRAEMRIGLVVLDPMAVRSVSIAAESSSGS
jgi:HK97 family phage major capsid protein